jgi:subtilisin family serine protease
MEQIVGVIDSGVDYNHVDLYQNIFLNELEIPASRRSNLTDIDADGLITFRDLNNAANQGAFKITDQNADGRITGVDLRATMGRTGGVDNGTGGWADGADADTNFLTDDLVGWNFLSNNNDPMDVFSHGTHVAGTIGATGNNGTGVVGVNWKVRVLPLKSGGINGGDNTISTSAAIASMNYAVSLKNRGEKVAATNNSWGGGGFSDTMLGAINAQNTAGIMFVAASGNAFTNNDTAPHFPSNYDAPNVISVMGTTQGNNRYGNFGPTTVDLGAPAAGVLSTVPGGGYAFFDGTSMASPHVAGAVALIKSLSPNLGIAALKNVLFSTIDPMTALNGLSVTGGRLNINKALLSVALAPTDAPDLQTASDSGFSTTDNITNDTTPTFSGLAAPNVTVRLHADGAQVGTTTSASDGTWTITSNALTNGTREMYVTVFNGTATSAASPSLFVKIDTIAPVASSGNFPFAAAPQRTTFNFNEPMVGAFEVDDVTVTNITGDDQVIPTDQLSIVHSANNQVEIRFPGVPSGLIRDGDYRVEVLATDAAGNAMATPYTYTFFIMYGDADRDRDADIADFAIMAGNFNSSPRNFGQGDFNLNGAVEIGDFALLAARFNTTLAAPGDVPADGASTSAAAPARSPFSANVIGDEDEQGSVIDDLSNGSPA